MLLEMSKKFPINGKVFMPSILSPSIRRVKIYAIFSLILILAGSATSYWVADRIGFYTSEIMKAEEVMQLTDALYLTILERESNIRAYIITGDRKFLENYENSIIEGEQVHRSLQNITSKNEIQQNYLRDLESIIRVRAEVFEKTKSYYMENKSLVGFLTDQRVNSAIDNYQNIKRIIMSINEEESRTFAEKNSGLLNNIRALPFTVSLISLLSIAMGLLTLFSVLHYNKNQKNAILQTQAYQDSLQEKLNLLDESNKELEQFAYVASHDLQEPLRKITSFSDLLIYQYRKELKGDGEMYLDRIISSSNRMKRLIIDLLEYSRAGRENDNSMEELELNIVIDQVIESLEILIVEKNAKLTVSDLPIVKGSNTELEQVFQNLISNAIKFSKPNKPSEIQIDSIAANKEIIKQFPHLEQDQAYHLIRISDNGIGFSEEYAQRIFTIFQRLHGKHEYEGTGIGLAITKRIIEKYKGVIFAQSKPYIGSTFNIIIPKIN